MNDTRRHRFARSAGVLLIAAGFLLPTPHRHARDGTRWCAPPFTHLVPGDPAEGNVAEAEFDQACMGRALVLMLGGTAVGVALYYAGNAPRRRRSASEHEDFHRTGRWPPPGT